MGIEGLMKVGIAVKDLEKVSGILADALGLIPGEVVAYKPYQMRYRIFTIGDFFIEVIEPTGSDGPIARFIETNGEGLQHMTFRVTNIEKVIAELKGKGVRFIQETPVQEKTPLGLANFVFLRPKECHGVLVQLMEIR